MIYLRFLSSISRILVKILFVRYRIERVSRLMWQRMASFNSHLVSVPYSSTRICPARYFQRLCFKGELSLQLFFFITFQAIWQ